MLRVFARRRFWLLFLFGVVAFALGLFLGRLAIRNLSFADLGSALSEVNPWLPLAAVALVLIAGYLRGVRWRLLLRPHDVSARRLFVIEQTGSALDTLSFIHLLDEVFEIGILTVRDRIPMGTVLATLAMQRTMEFGTTVIVLGGGALLLPEMRDYTVYLATGVGIAALSIVLLVTIGPALGRIPIIGRVRFIMQFAEAAGLMRSEWPRALAAFGISIVQAVALGAAGWLLIVATGSSLDVLASIVVTLAVQFFGAVVPGLPLAVGNYEYAAVELFELWGESAEAAVSFTVLLRGLFYVPPLVIGAIFLSREGLLSVGAIRRLIRESRAGALSE